MSRPDGSGTDVGAPSSGHTTTPRVLTTGKVVFLVLAAIAPMTGVVSVAPLAFGFGGPSSTAAYVFVALVLLCFASGYAEMGKTMPSAGALYTYIRRGLGSTAAGAGAVLALLGYSAVLVGAAATSVYYFQYILATDLGIDIPWGWLLLVLAVVVGALSTRQIDLNAKVVGIVVVCEIAVMLVLDIAIVVANGIGSFTVDVFRPEVISSGFPGVAIMYAFLSFLGFEAASLYAGEAKDPNRTIPRALVVSILLLGSFFVLCTWLAAGGVGSDAIQARAAEEGGELYFSLARQFAGNFLAHAMSVVLVTSLFATTLGMTNFASRYLQSLSAEGLAPRWFAGVSSHTGVPRRAAAGYTVLFTVVVGGLGLLGADPYLDTGAVMFGLGALTIVLLQSLAAVAIVRYLSKPESKSDHQGGPITRTVAPALGLVGLLVGLTLILHSFATITGKTGTLYELLPFVPFAAAAVGAALGWVNRPGSRRIARVTESSKSGTPDL